MGPSTLASTLGPRALLHRVLAVSSPMTMAAGLLGWHHGLRIHVVVHWVFRAATATATAASCHRCLRTLQRHRRRRQLCQGLRCGHSCAPVIRTQISLTPPRFTRARGVPTYEAGEVGWGGGLFVGEGVRTNDRVRYHPLRTYVGGIGGGDLGGGDRVAALAVVWASCPRKYALATHDLCTSILA